METPPLLMNSRLLAAKSLRVRAESYRELGRKCHDQKIADTVEILAVELFAAAMALDAMN